MSIPIAGVSQIQLSEQYGSGNSPLLSFYQNTISQARGVSCPMHPSCSQYAKLAFAQHAGLRAFALTTDRLMRCGHDLKQYESISLNSGTFYYDVFNDSTSGKARYQTFFKPNQKDSTFIEFLINKKRFEEARLELWREIYKNKGTATTPKLFFTIGKTYFIDEEYTELFKFYAENSSAFSVSTYNDSIKVLLTKAYLHSGRYQAAQVSVNNLYLSMSNSDETIFLDGLVALHVQDVDKCELKMRSVSSTSKYYKWATSFNGVSADYRALKRKPPVAASILSAIVPGSGYLVSGKKGTAFTALVINAMFALITVEAFQHNNNALGISTAVIGSGWYFGSIIGSYNSTVKWNTTQRENFIKHKTLPINLN